MGDILEKGDKNMANDDWDIFDKQIKRSIEISRRTMDLCIEPYIKELAIYKRALELACDSIRDMYCSDHCLCRRDESCKEKCIYKEYYNEKQFIDQAKKELEEQE